MYSSLALWQKDVANGSELGMARLRALLDSLVLRRCKTQKRPDGTPILALPTRSVHQHSVKLSAAERDVYEQLQRDAWRGFKSAGKPGGAHALRALLQLRLCCCDPRLLQLTPVDLGDNDFDDVDALTRDMASMTLSSGDAADKLHALTAADTLPSVPAKIRALLRFLTSEAFLTAPPSSPPNKIVIFSQWTRFLDSVSDVAVLL